MIFEYGMHVKMKNTNTTYFSDLLRSWMEKHGFNQPMLSQKSGIQQGRLSQYLTGKTEPGLDNLLKLADAFDISLSEFFALADETTHGKSPPLEKAGEAPAPPVAGQTPPTPGPSREDDLEALKQKLETARDRNDKLTDELLAANAIRNDMTAELLAKAKVISTTAEALRIKDIEIAEKRERLTAKDKLIQQLVDLLKEAGLEHTIPPALINSIRADRERSQER